WRRHPMKPRTALLMVTAILTPALAIAGPITYSFSSGTRAASATFAKSGSNLIITLTNTSAADAMVDTDILTAVYFTVTGSPTLTPISAVVPPTSDVFDIGPGTLVTPGDRVVGGEWAYRNVALPHGNNEGVSSTGLGVFGPPDLFPGPDLQPPVSPNG